MKRYHILDEIRGITIISMLMYHTMWDIVEIFDKKIPWLNDVVDNIWQNSICITFIFLSGFCYCFGKRKLYRGLQVLGGGIIISVVTHLVTPDFKIWFGILTMLGVSMLLMIPLEKYLAKVPGLLGFLICIVCFVITKNINDGYLSFGPFKLLDLPEELFNKGDIMTFIGFTDRNFTSGDYFSLIPWFLIFVAGFYLNRIMVKKEWMSRLEKMPSLGKWLQMLGTHSLIIYMIHQPIIYGVLHILF